MQMGKKNEVITCSNGHKFPLNRCKHEHDRYVLCPKCKGEVQIRKRILGFNIEWSKIKLHNATIKADIKRLRTKPESTPSIPYIGIRDQALGLLHLSMLMKKQMDDEKKKGN
jgi:hypothetical protein